MGRESGKTGISVIVPFLNEEEGILLFCETVDAYAAGLDFPVELVFVNDGSTDRGAEMLKTYRFQHIENAQLINLSKNFGSHCAMPRDSSGPTVACLCQHPSPTTRHPHPFPRRNRPSATRNRTRCHHRHPLHTPLHPITRQRPVRCDHL